MDKEQKSGRKPLRAVISEIDQEILRLLVRRSNLLAKLRENGRLPASEEKFLREAWQNDVARVSRDPGLSGRFFTLMQQVSFLPRPKDGASEADSVPGSQRRDAFNLAPPKKPADIALAAPLSGWQTRMWLYLAAQAGQELRLAPCLQNDGLVDYVKGLAQMGAAVTREDDAILCRSASPLGAPDKVLHAGGSELNFYVFLAQYLGRHSRVKITGDAVLQLADYTGLKHFLPALGARMINIVPRSAGLPVRIESSGALPPGIRPGPELQAGFIEALLLAAPGYSAPFAIDLSLRPDREAILARALPLLEASGAIFSLSEAAISLEPSSLVIPSKPELGVEPELAAFLLAFPAALGGKTTLNGHWPDWPKAALFWETAARFGFTAKPGLLEASFAQPAQNFACADFQPETEWQTAFLTAVATCVCLNGGAASLPAQFQESGNAADFMRIAGVALLKDGKLARAESPAGLAWNAPSPAWALALALAACCRKGQSGWALGNPGIMTELWPPFWSLYNGLPEPKMKKPQPKAPEKAQRRRIITNAVATPPEIRDEDLY